MRPSLQDAVVVDFETAVGNGYSLRKMSVRQYVFDERFNVLSVAIGLGQDRIQFFSAAPDGQHQSLEAGRAVLAQAARDGRTFVAHNTGFDAFIAAVGWGVPFDHYFDTAGYARYLGIGASLENAAAYYGYQKLEAPAFTEASLRDPQARRKLARYNAADVALARVIFRAALDDNGYPDAEVEINDLTARMNLAGIRVDTTRASELAHRLAELHAETMSSLASEYAFNTSDLRRGASVRAFAMKTWGLALGSLDKRDVDLRDAIRANDGADRFFRLRDRAHTLSRAMQKVQACSGILDARVYGFLRYYGAHTGRFSAGGRDAEKFNVHQLYKTKNRAGIPELGCERELVVPSDGMNLVAADLATVEARIVAWVAGEQALLEQFEADTDVYIWFVSQIFSGVTIVKAGENDHLRQLGKESILGLGFGMGLDTFMKKVREVMPTADADLVRTLFDAYQASFPRIRSLRYAMMNAFTEAATHRQVAVVGHCTFEPSTEPAALSPTVVVRLPTGRALYYRSVVDQHEATAWGVKRAFWYAPHAELTNKPSRARGKGERLFADGQRRVRITPQVLVENSVQAIARDVMVHQLLELERRGLRPSFHAHDEEIFECKACLCFAAESGLHDATCTWRLACALVAQVMSSLPETLMPALAGLPLKAEVKTDVRKAYAG